MGDIRALLDDPEFKALTLEQKDAALGAFKARQSGSPGSVAGDAPGGSGRAFLQGLAQAPGSIPHALGAASEWLGGKIGVPAGGGFERAANVIDETMEVPFKIETGRGFIDPQPGEGMAGAAGRGVGGFLTLPLGGMGGLASSIIGSIAAESAKEAGLPGWAQIVAGVAGSASPGALGAIAPRIPGVAAVTGRVGRGLSPTMRADAARMGAAQTLRGNVGNVPQAADALARESHGLNGPGLASTAQTLRREAPGMIGLEGGLVKTSSAGLGERLAARRAENASQIDDAYGAALRGDPAAVRPGLTSRIAASKKDYQKLYDAIDDASVGPVSLAGVKAEAKAIADEAGQYGAKTVPRLAKLVAEADDVTSFTDLRRLRTALTDETRSLRASVKMGGSAEELRNASRLLSKVDDEIDALGSAGTPAAGQLRTANAAYREHQALYSRAHPTVRKLLDNEDPGDAIAALLSRGTARPAEDARRLVAGLKGDADSIEGLRRLTADELVWRASGRAARAEGAVSPSSVSGANLGGALTENEPALRVIFGDEQFDLLRRLAARIDATTYGRAGTPGFYMSTGSALKSAEQQGAAGADAVADALGAIMSPAGAVRRKAAEKAREWLADKATLDQQRRLLEDAMVDPKVARDLLLDVTPERFTAWQARMKQHIEASGVRAGITMPRGEKE